MLEKIIRFVLTFIRTFKNVSLVIEYEERLSSLKALKDMQCTDGTWDYDHYMHGYANGIILSISVLENKSANFLNAPKEFIRVKENEEKNDNDLYDTSLDNSIEERTILKFPDPNRKIVLPKSDCYCDD